MEKRNNDKIDKYKIALEIAHNEGKILWESSQVFLLSSTILGAFIAQAANNSLIKSWEIFIPSLIGFAVACIWFVSHQRRSSYYNFRMAQVRELEPTNWNLIAGKGYVFSQGIEVKLKNVPYNLPAPAKYFTTHTIIQFIISLFIIGYFLLIILSWPC